MSRINKSVSTKASTLLRAGRISRTIKSYKEMPKDFSLELKEFILSGCRMRKTYSIKPEHIEQALQEVRRGK